MGVGVRLQANARRRRITGSRNPFPELLNSDFKDFYEAQRVRLAIGSYKTPCEPLSMSGSKLNVIDERLQAERELKKRFDEARRKPLGILEGDNVAFDGKDLIQPGWRTDRRSIRSRPLAFAYVAVRSIRVYRSRCRPRPGCCVRSQAAR